MSKFEFIKTSIDGLYLIKPKLFRDDRGYFFESYSKKEFFDAGLKMEFVQDNQSFSKQGVLRGLHFQTINSQGKLVRVIKGEIFDVAVDLRKESSTYGSYEAFILNEENQNQLYIPEGFAHGFLTLSDEAIINYKCTDYYNPQGESGIIFDDSTLGIKWPLDKVKKVILSEKDRCLPKL